MKKIFYSLSFLALCACGNTNQKAENQDSLVVTTTTESNKTEEPVDSVNAPKFKFEEEIHDFGDIKAGDEVQHEFKFTNVGKKDLIISDARASCGCTIPEKPEKPIAPGASEIIKVKFNSTGKSGLVNKDITITANTVPTTTIIKIRANIK